MEVLGLSRRFSHYCKLFIASFLLIVFPAYTTPSYSFAEFNIAFILGLSLPLLLIIALLKSFLAIKWRYPALLTLTLFGQLYALAYLTQWQEQVLLASAAGFILVTHFWFSTCQKVNRSTNIALSLVSASFAAFIACLFFTPQLDVYLVWLLYAGFVSLITITRVIQQELINSNNLRVISQWLLVLCFSYLLYLWLNTRINIVWVISTSVMCYLVAVMNGCWSLVQSLFGKFEQLQVEQKTAMLTQKTTAMVPLDPVTNLPTYQQVLAQFFQEIQSKPDASFAAIVFKPINFHLVNKVLGHQNSDILLLQLAYNLQKSLVDNELLINFNQDQPKVKIARLQGLDFIVILDSSLSQHPVKLLVDNLCLQLSQSVPKAMSFKSFSLNFELVFGVSILGEHNDTAEQVIAQAGDALLDAEYEHKQINYFDNQTVIHTKQQLSKMEHLKSDLDNERLEWFAQPQASLVSDKLIGFQLVMHWPAIILKDLNISQKEVYQLAEYSGEIYRITQAYIRHAADLLSTCHQNDFTIDVAVNLSSQALFEPELVDYMLTQLNRVNIMAKYLVIEIDEELFFSKQHQVKKVIDQLQANGFSVAINQFSGSFEALRYIRRVAINRVIIDASQLEKTSEDQTDKAIVNALINVTRKMELPVVATGINTQVLAESYLGIGGDFAQGKKVGGAIKITDIKEWLFSWVQQRA